MREIVTATQINIFDSRFYRVPLIKGIVIPKHLEYLIFDNDIYLPSSTHILDVSYDKGEQFREWLKSVGQNARVVAGIAGETGSRDHRVCEMLLDGEEISYDQIIDTENKYIPKHMSFDEWKNILKFKEFIDQVNPTDIISESIVYNLEYGYAGTVDIQCKINGENWVIDIKFGNQIYDSSYLQVESYARCLENIDHIGILHMKAATRGIDKTGKKTQGKGWRLFEPTNRVELWETWKSLLNIYKFKANGETPKEISYPKTIKL